MAPQAASILATDAAEETLEIAKRRGDTKKVEFCLADAYALPDPKEPFDGAFAGFWISHVPLQRLRPFLDGLHARLAPESVVLFLDNLFVEGNSTPIVERDGEGNTYQLRKLRDGTFHRVLKNFSSEADLENMIEGIGTNPQYRQFTYYWAFQYKTPPLR